MSIKGSGAMNRPQRVTGSLDKRCAQMCCAAGEIFVIGLFSID
jgi:hypothetical protein